MQHQRRQSRAGRWLGAYPRAMPLGLFILIAAITVMSVVAIERGESQREAAGLSTDVIATAYALERRANASSAYLRAGAALLSTMDDVPADDFRRFVSELRLDSSNQGDAIGWAQVVRPGEEVPMPAMFRARTLRRRACIRARRASSHTRLRSPISSLTNRVTGARSASIFIPIPCAVRRWTKPNAICALRLRRGSC